MRMERSGQWRRATDVKERMEVCESVNRKARAKRAKT